MKMLIVCVTLLAFAFVERSLKFKKSDCVKHTMKATIVDYHIRQRAMMLGPAKVTS